MSALSHKQRLFKNYLLKKLGFLDDEFLKNYISILEKISPRFSILGKKRKIWNEEDQRFYPENIDVNKKYIEKENYFIPEKFNIIDLLNIELNIKKNKDYICKKIQLETISATDISNYTYCPISFAISKTFELPKYESSIIGTSLHNENTLINYLQAFKDSHLGLLNAPQKILTGRYLDRYLNRYQDEYNQIFFDELKQSSIIFHGHNSLETTKYFKSKIGNYVGQPDYIFKNESSNNFFVVEEKFQYIPSSPSFHNKNITDEEIDNIEKKRKGKPFSSNHINQLKSYLYGINEYELKYGFLLYWLYQLDNGNQSISSCKVLRIEKTEKGREEIREVFINIKNLINNKEEKFDIKLRVPSKCASCVSNLLCGHKLGNFNSFTIPYSNRFLKTYFSPFPEELIKPKLPNENEGD